MGAICCHANQSSDPNYPQNSLFPQPNDDSDKIWLRSVLWSQRYSCLKKFTDGPLRTDGWSDAGSSPILQAHMVSRIKCMQIQLYGQGQ